MADAICGLSQKRSDGSAGGGCQSHQAALAGGEKREGLVKKIHVEIPVSVPACLYVLLLHAYLKENYPMPRETVHFCFFTFKMDDDMQCAALNLPNR